MVRRLDREGAIRSLDGAAAPDEACLCYRDALLARFHASKDGKLGSGTAAFVTIWRTIPRLRPLGLSARAHLVRVIIEQAYRPLLEVRLRVERLAMRSSPI